MFLWMKKEETLRCQPGRQGGQKKGVPEKKKARDLRKHKIDIDSIKNANRC